MSIIYDLTPLVLLYISLCDRYLLSVPIQFCMLPCRLPAVYLTHLSLHPEMSVIYIIDIIRSVLYLWLYWYLCIVPFIYVSPQSPHVCTWPSFRPLALFTAIHLCLTSTPDPPSTPFPYHMRAAHLLSSVHVLSHCHPLASTLNCI